MATSRASRASSSRSYEVLFQMVIGKWISQALGTVVEIGVPEQLAKGPRRCSDIAREAGVSANCMQSFGWFVTTAVALYCIRSGNVALHRRWMIRSYLFAMVSPLPVLSTSSRLTRLETPCSANFVLIEGQEEQHPEGSYYIEWYDGNKRLRRSVGKNALAAEAIRHQHEQVLTAKADGLKAGLKFAEESNRPSLRSRNDYS
jgi:hypothetical protein